MRQYLLWALGAGTAFVVLQANAQEPAYSAKDQRLLSYLSDPDRLYIRPGNDGTFAFTVPRATHSSNLQPWQDEYCDARQLELDSENYTVRLGTDDTSQTVEYWGRMAEYMNARSMNAEMPVWVINDALVKTAENNPGLIDDVTSRALRLRRDGYVTPMLLFDFDDWSVREDAAYRKVDEALSGWLLMVRVTEGNLSRVRGRRWAGVVVDEEAVPVHYRGQAMLNWLHQVFGQVPVLISPEIPDFFKETIWLSSGAAGIYYRPLPEPGTPENEQAAIHLRASSTFMGRFGDDPVSLAGRPESQDFLFNLEVVGQSWAGAVRSGTAKAKLMTPEWMVGRAVGGAWFNPATDENIIEPLTTATQSVKLTPPSDALWLYSRTVSTAVPDTATTVAGIRGWED